MIIQNRDSVFLLFFMGLYPPSITFKQLLFEKCKHRFMKAIFFNLFF